MNAKLQRAYNTCLKISREHYENFPVASFFLPKKIQLPIAAIYAFARTADDFADSNKLTTEVKLASLEVYQQRLTQIAAGKNPDANNVNAIPIKAANVFYADIFLAVADTINTHKLPIKLFQDLLLAFIQDASKNRYYDFDEVLGYCEQSANPIGQLLLHLTGNATHENIIYSNFICTGLQLINFMQDIYDDITKLDRCYIPTKELDSCGIDIDQLRQKVPCAKINELINYQLSRIQSIYEQGAPLTTTLNGTFGFYLKLIFSGGVQILTALNKRQDHFSRPTLSLLAKFKMLRHAVLT